MPVNTAIRVINVEGSTERRNDFSTMAAKTKLEWEFFPACTGLVPPLSYDNRRASRRWGRPMSKSEIGCYASHFKLWEWLVNSDYDQAIIFEDDLIASWPIIELIANRDWAKDGVDLLRLMSCWPFRWKLVQHRFLAPHVHLIKIDHITFSTLGYLLTKKAARLLMSKYADITAPIDLVIGRYWEHNLHNYCIFPFPIMESGVSSIIGAGRHDLETMCRYDRIAFWFWEKRDKLGRFLFRHLNN